MKKKIQLFRLVRVKKVKTHIKELYKLLKTRKFNISNKNLPNFAEHKSFVINHPYRLWYLIEVKKKYVGTLYLLKDNCIGLYLREKYKKFIKKIIIQILQNVKPLPEIKSIRSKDFFINLAINDKNSSKQLLKLGAKKLQTTYSMKNVLNNYNEK